MNLDKRNLAESSPEKLHLLDPITGVEAFDDDGKPVTIELYSADSDVFRKAIRKYGNKQLNEKQNRRKSMEEFEANSSKILAQATVGWSGLHEHDSELVFNLGNAERLYMQYPWIREQVEEFINDRANFLK